MKVFMSIAGLRLAAPAVAEPTMALLIRVFRFPIGPLRTVIESDTH